jgi:hypothetical protein
MIEGIRWGSVMWGCDGRPISLAQTNLQKEHQAVRDYCQPGKNRIVAIIELKVRIGASNVQGRLTREKTACLPAR